MNERYDKKIIDQCENSDKILKMRASVYVWILDGKVFHTTEVRKKEWMWVLCGACWTENELPGHSLGVRSTRWNKREEEGRKRSRAVIQQLVQKAEAGDSSFSSPSTGRPVKLCKEVRLRCVSRSPQDSSGNSCLDSFHRQGIVFRYGAMKKWTGILQGRPYTTEE